jgi:hypothetical protein
MGVRRYRARLSPRRFTLMHVHQGPTAATDCTETFQDLTDTENPENESAQIQFPIREI